MMLYTDIDYHFFEKIDTEEKAYFLGFLYSDGNVSKNLTSVTLKLHKKDTSILERLKNLICQSYFIKITQKKYCYFRVNRKQICNQLIALGCTPKKSLTLQFPTPEQVPEHLLNHFIRGYSDGDGCISFHKLSTGRKEFSWSVVSTLYFCKKLKQICKEKLNINCHIKQTSKNNIITHTLHVGGALQLNKLFNWMYTNSSIHMDRKYSKYLEFVDQTKGNKFIDRGSFKVDKDLIINLYQLGNSKQKVAKLMNCDVKTVYNILKINNIATIKKNSVKRKNLISNNYKYY